MDFNRRDFLRGASLAALTSAAGCDCGKTGRTALPWIETDVLAVGGGPAGTCAAVSAARLGAKVVLAERSGSDALAGT